MEVLNNILIKLTTGELILSILIIVYILYVIFKAITKDTKANNLFIQIIRKVFKIKDKEENDDEEIVRRRIHKSSDLLSNIEAQISSQSAFDRIDFILYSKIPTYEYGSYFKNIVYRNYFTMLGKTFKTNIKQFSLSRDFKNMNNEELSSVMMKLINTTIYETERKIELDGVPEEIIRIMKIRNNQLFSIMTHLVEKTCKSHIMFAEHSIIKMFSALHIISSIIENILVHSVETVTSSNIDYTDMDYNGIKA